MNPRLNNQKRGLTSLNPVLARWLDDRAAPAVDCRACPRPRKCCDFQPFVPNFLAGAMLSEGITFAPDEWRFARQPLGLVPSHRFRRERDQHACAFLNAGRCGVWAWRPGECSTYNCVVEAPDLSRLAFDLETTIAQMALTEQGYGTVTVRTQIDILNDPGEDLGHDHEAETVYRRAWTWARTLSRADVARWLEDV